MKNWTELLELMDTKVDLDVSWDEEEGFETDFKVGKHEYHFAAMLDDSGENEYEVVFSRLIRNEKGRLSKAEFGVTSDMSMKDALKVFSGVKASLQQWLKKFKGKEKPDFYFSAKADEASRQKLYDKMSKQIAKKLGYAYDRMSRGKSVFYQFYA